MEPIYKHQFTVSENHVDRFGRVKPSMLLYFVQEAAGQHCALLAVDHDTLSHQHLFWAVTRNRVQITRLPRLGEKVYIETWPMPTTRVAYPRSVVAYDEKGEELFRSISLWVLMDDRTRAMILPGKSGVIVDGTLTGTELSVPRAIVARPMGGSKICTVGYSLLDRNGHMNNTRYMDWISDLLPSAFHQNHSPREFTVCYLSESREGQQLELAWDFPEEGCLLMDAHRNTDNKQERIFAAKVIFD